MASCGSTTCDKFDATGAKWFKIDQMGKKDANTWDQEDISQSLVFTVDSWPNDYTVQGDSLDIVLPQDIAPGGYLVRHEVGTQIIRALMVIHINVQIIALHLAMTMGGAEFYPSCTQILIGGNGNTQPDSTLSFPGAYHDDDPGIYVPNVRRRRIFCIPKP